MSDKRQRDGFEVTLAIVDRNRTDDEGRPWMITTNQHFANYELARMDDRDFIEMVMRQMAGQLIGTLRDDGYLSEDEKWDDDDL